MDQDIEIINSKSKNNLSELVQLSTVIIESLLTPNNSLSQLGWYTLMINLHETGWHSEGEIAGWEHHYSSHMKNANVYAEAARWANGDYAETTAAFFSDIDHDGGDELVMHNDKILSIANIAQKKAIKHPPAPLMIIAGAGTGKTFTLENRIVYLILILV